MNGLYKCSINYTYDWVYRNKGAKKYPVYVVAASKERAIDYVNGSLKHGCTVTNVIFLGNQLSNFLFHGKE